MTQFKAGDKVMVRKLTKELADLGFKTYCIYTVTGQPSHLNVKTSDGHYVYLTDGQGPTPNADLFEITSSIFD